MRRMPVTALLLCAACTLAACDKATLSLAVADAPVDDANRIVVEFSGVILEHSDGGTESFDFVPPRQIDLLEQTDGRSELLLDDVSVPDGNYVAVRLKINAGDDGTDSFLELADASRHALFLPAANQPGLRIATAFGAERNESVSLTVDFDLRRSVLKPGTGGGPYRLAPSLRLVETHRAGAIEGGVADGLAGSAGCRPAVYVYAGSSITPDDAGSPTPPFASALVRESAGSFVYHVAFLPAGPYTAAFTCEAASDDPESNETIVFLDQANVSVTEGGTATVDFE